MMKKFLFYGIAGWSIEIIWTGIGSMISGDLRLMAHSNLWMFLIYGCAMFFEPVHHAIADRPWFFRGLFWLMVIWIIEYYSGAILYRVLGVHPWYYTDKFAVNGMITFLYGPAWFMAGMGYERLHAALDSYMMVREKQ